MGKVLELVVLLMDQLAQQAIASIVVELGGGPVPTPQNLGAKSPPASCRKAGSGSSLEAIPSPPGVPGLLGNPGFLSWAGVVIPHVPQHIVDL